MAGKESAAGGGFRFGRIWLLGFGMLGVSLLWQVYNAYVPLFLQAGRADFSQGAGLDGFGLDTTRTGFIMTLDNIAALLILPYVGVVSDRLRSRFGRRKPFLAIGAPIAALAIAAVPFAAPYGLAAFLAAVVVLILAMDLFRTPLTALLPDLAPPERRSPANGILSLMYGVGSVLAFAVGGWLFRFSPAAPFLFAAGGLLAATAVVLLFVREPERPEAAEGPPSFRVCLREVVESDRSIVRLLAAILAWHLGVSALEVFFTSYVVNTFSVDSGGATGLLAFFALAGLLGAIPAGLIGARIGRRRAILLGLALLICLLTSVFPLNSLTALRVLLLGMGLSWSLIMVNALPMALDYAPPGRSGTYVGLFLLSSQLASVIGPVLAGSALGLAGNEYRYLWLYVPSTMAVALVLMLGVRRGEAGPPRLRLRPDPAAEPVAAGPNR